MDFLRYELQQHLKELKSISYHPEVDKVHGLKDLEISKKQRIETILKEHRHRVETFLTAKIPSLAPNWRIATCSFRPLQEQGRNLSVHASNELIHVDAGAYGATHGDRILRFFVNIHPTESREWASKGTFPLLFKHHAEKAGLSSQYLKKSLKKGWLERLYSDGLVKHLAKIMPIAHMADTSPYDRTMRQFHNYMKENSEFQQNISDVQKFSFEPFSAWMVFTDMLSHACLSGQYAFVTTIIVPQQNCRAQELVPLNILKAKAAYA